MFRLFLEEIGENILKKYNYDKNEMIKNEGKTIFDGINFKAKLSYGLIGSRVADFKYWKEINNQTHFILKHNDKEDMALSFLGKDKCLYLVPGSANIAFEKGLHGYMFLNVASYDNFLLKFVTVVKLRRSLIIFLIKFLNILKFKNLFRKIF